MLEPLDKLWDPRLQGTVPSLPRTGSPRAFLHTTVITNTAWGNKDGGAKKDRPGWPCGANGGGEQANIFQWGEGLGEYQGCTLAKMYLSRYQCAGVTILKNQIDPQFISMRPEELGPRARINVLSTYCPLNSWRGQF